MKRKNSNNAQHQPPTKRAKKNTTIRHLPLAPDCWRLVLQFFDMPTIFRSKMLLISKQLHHLIWNSAVLWQNYEPSFETWNFSQAHISKQSKYFSSLQRILLLQNDPKVLVTEAKEQELSSHLKQLKVLKFYGDGISVDNFAQLPALEEVHIWEAVVNNKELKIPQVKKLCLYLHTDVNRAKQLLDVFSNVTGLSVVGHAIKIPIPEKIQSLQILNFTIFETSFDHCNIQELRIKCPEFSLPLCKQVCALKNLKSCTIEAEQWCDQMEPFQSTVLEQLKTTCTSHPRFAMLVVQTLKQFSAHVPLSQSLVDKLKLCQNLEYIELKALNPLAKMYFYLPHLEVDFTNSFSRVHTIHIEYPVPIAFIYATAKLPMLRTMNVCIGECVAHIDNEILDTKCGNMVKRLKLEGYATHSVLCSSLSRLFPRVRRLKYKMHPEISLVDACKLVNSLPCIEQALILVDEKANTIFKLKQNLSHMNVKFLTSNKQLQWKLDLVCMGLFPNSTQNDIGLREHISIADILRRWIGDNDELVRSICRLAMYERVIAFDSEEQRHQMVSQEQLRAEDMVSPKKLGKLVSALLQLFN